MTKLYKLLLVMFGVFAVAGLTHADTITDNDVQFTATVTGTTVTLQIQCLDTSVCGSWYLGDVSLKGFTFTGSPTLGTAPSGYTVQNGGQNNDAVGSGGGCNGTQIGMAVCWDAPTILSTQLGGGINTFTANIANGTADTLHVQATAYDNTAGTQQGGGKVLAVSDDLLPGGGGGGGGSTVPEPSTLILFGSSLLSLVGLRRYSFSKPS